MITASNRVPGQVLPVGARYWYNAGKPIPALKSLSGSPSLGFLGYETPVLDFVLNAGMGGVVGVALAKAKGGDATVGAALGALSGGFFGLFGVAVQAGIALGGIEKARKYRASRKR